MMWYIFEKELVQGPQKQWAQVKNKNVENLQNLENQENQENQAAEFMFISYTSIQVNKQGSHSGHQDN